MSTAVGRGFRVKNGKIERKSVAVHFKVAKDRKNKRRVDGYIKNREDKK